MLLPTLMSCENDGQKIFNANNLNALDLACIDGFWVVGAEIDTSDYITAHFNNHPEFIDCLRFSSGVKYVGISVFESQSSAINAMQARIETVACVIEEGTTDEIKDTWWFTECIPNGVFVNKLNTIIEAGIYSTDFNSVKDTLYRTVNQIASRVFEYSE